MTSIELVDVEKYYIEYFTRIGYKLDKVLADLKKEMEVLHSIQSGAKTTSLTTILDKKCYVDKGVKAYKAFFLAIKQLYRNYAKGNGFDNYISKAYLDMYLKEMTYQRG